MRTREWFGIIVVCVVLALSAHAQCVKDDRSKETGGWLVTDLHITGTQNLSSEELLTIASVPVGWCIDPDEDELRTIVKVAFQEHRYLGLKINDVHAKDLDPAIHPTPIVLEVDVIEGPRYKLAGVEFTGNHALSKAVLREKLPIKRGDPFQRSRVVGAMDGIREEYERHGFLDCVFIVDDAQSVKTSDATVSFKFQITEGPQYRMGKLLTFAQDELGDKLRARWKIPPGAVYDGTYPEDFVRENASILPAGFTPDQIQVVKDCPNALVEVRVILDPALEAVQPMPKPVPCDAQTAGGGK